MVTPQLPVPRAVSGLQRATLAVTTTAVRSYSTWSADLLLSIRYTRNIAVLKTERHDWSASEFRGTNSKMKMLGMAVPISAIKNLQYQSCCFICNVFKSRTVFLTVIPLRRVRTGNANTLTYELIKCGKQKGLLLNLELTKLFIKLGQYPFSPYLDETLWRRGETSGEDERTQGTRLRFRLPQEYIFLPYFLRELPFAETHSQFTFISFQY